MSAFDILQRWLQPLLDPLNEVRSVIQTPLSIHQEAVSTFASLVAGLYEGPDAFQGEAADAAKATTESYLNAEAQFSGAGSVATGTFAAAAILTVPTAATDTVLEDAADTSVECAVEITSAATTAATEMGADAGLDAVTEVVDVAAVAQAGLDPVTDIPAGVLTAIDLGTKIVILAALGWSIFQAVQHWIGDMNRLGHITWPPLPSFMDTYSNVQNAGKPLTPQQQRTIDDAILRLSGMGIYFNSSDVENLARLGLTPEEIVEAIQAKNQLTPMRARFSLYRLAVLVKMGYGLGDIITIVTKVNESSTQFRSNDERWIGNWLVLNGIADSVIPIAASKVRDGDAVVELHLGRTVRTVRMEFKTLEPDSSGNSLNNRLESSLKRGGQASYMVFDVSKTKITVGEAQRFLDQAKSRLLRKNIKAPLDYILIIGNGFVLEAQY